MKLKYSLSRDDFLTHQLFVASLSKRIKRQRLLAWLILPLIYVLMALSMWYIENFVFFIAFLSVALVWLVLYPFYSRWRFRRHYGRHIDEYYKSRIDTVGTVTLEDDEIHFSDETSEGKVKLQELEGLVDIPGYIFVLLNKVGAIVLPKETIGEENLRPFVEELQRLTGVEVEEVPDWKWR